MKRRVSRSSSPSRKRAWVAAHAALRAAVRQAQERALPRHPHGERGALAERHRRVVADAALRRAEHARVLHAVAGKTATEPSSQAHRNRDRQRALREAQHLARPPAGSRPRSSAPSSWPSAVRKSGSSSSGGRCGAVSGAVVTERSLRSRLRLDRERQTVPLDDAHLDAGVCSGLARRVPELPVEPHLPAWPAFAHGHRAPADERLGPGLDLAPPRVISQNQVSPTSTRPPTTTSTSPHGEGTTNTARKSETMKITAGKRYLPNGGRTGKLAASGTQATTTGEPHGVHPDPLDPDPDVRPSPRASSSCPSRATSASRRRASPARASSASRA